MIGDYIRYSFYKKNIKNINHSLKERLIESVFYEVEKVNDKTIKQLVSQLKLNKKIIEVTDLGAGSKKSKSTKRQISTIAKTAIIKPKYGVLLNVLINEFNCLSVVELGTSLGVGAAYLALKNNKSTIHTIEGCEIINRIAKSNIQSLGFTNVKFYTGEFSAVLNEVISNSGPADLVYIDGNHTYDATINYYKFFLKNSNANSIFIFDDIHWSKGMTKAWNEIIESKEAKLTLDLFRLGIVFLGENLEKENFVLNY